MKKIVALVLSLVMALSLATVAFGVDYIENGLYELKDKTLGTVDYDKYLGTVKKVDAVKNADGSGDIEYYTGEFNGVDHYYVPCEKADATHAVNTNNSFTTYVHVYYSVNIKDYIHYDAVATAVDANKGPADCTTTHYVVDGYLMNGDFYVKGYTKNNATQKNLLVNGKIIVAGNATNDDAMVVWASHVLLKGTKNVKTGWYETKCAICGGTFAYTDSMDVLKNNSIKESDTFFYSTRDAKNVIAENKAAGKYSLPVGTDLAGTNAWAWQISAGTETKPADTKPGVGSAKTFDAGIAMYVGMSLLSVAGSAVVIGKKKEF